MSFKQTYPDFATIENHIHRARVERAVMVSQAIVAGVQATIRGLKLLRNALERNFHAELDRRAVEADAFLKRSVPR